MIKLSELEELAKNREDQNKIKEAIPPKWDVMRASNYAYVVKNGLNVELRFFRIFYVPYERLIIISGESFKTN